MTDHQQNIWPVPKFWFEVQWDDSTLRFQEVSGLDARVEPVEYRSGGTPSIATHKLPGLRTVSTITMKKGIAPKDDGLFDWINQMDTNTITRKPLTITLLDETGTARVIWRVQNALPVKVQAGALDARSSTIAIETIEIAHEGFTREDP